MRMTTIGLLLLASLSLCAAAPFNPYKPEIVNEDTEEYSVAKDNVKVHFHETNMSDLDAKRNGKIHFSFDGAYGDVSIINNQKGTGGAWSGWSEFGPCSATCGAATKKRERTCNGGDECPGSNEDIVDCTLSDCGAFAIDGSWTEFSAWSDCSKTCGEGEKARSRTCTNPSPSDGGVDCEGQSKEVQSCVEAQNCPIDGGWTSFGTCTKTCKGGLQTRTCTNPSPQHGGEHCSGEASQSCNEGVECLGPVYFIAGGTFAERDISLYDPTVDNVVCSSIPPTLNNDWAHHSTFYHDNTIHLCGGSNTASICISHSKGTEGWKTHTLTTSRISHSSVVLHNRVYFIGGKSSVFTPENNLDYKGSSACVAKIDEDNLVVTGGKDSSGYLTTVATYNVKTRTYTQLPPLKQSRESHGCGVLERGNTKWIVVAGGYNYGIGGRLQSTEMLQLGGRSWTLIGNLNGVRTEHAMAVTQRGVMVMGGYGDSSWISSVELLDWDSKTWSVVEPSLNKPRRTFGGTVEIPASLFGCSG